MNVRRGMFWLWLVFTITWVFISASRYKPIIPIPGWDPLRDYSWGEVFNACVNWNGCGSLAGIWSLFFPLLACTLWVPAALLLFWFIGGWIKRGARHDH
jgi:hypothetical protein